MCVLQLVVEKAPKELRKRNKHKKKKKTKQNYKHVLPNKTVVCKRSMNHRTIYCSRNRSWLRNQTWVSHTRNDQCTAKKAVRDAVLTATRDLSQSVGVAQNTPSRATNGYVCMWFPKLQLLGV
jgi:hypothetical protein